MGRLVSLAMLQASLFVWVLFQAGSMLAGLTVRVLRRLGCSHASPYTGGCSALRLRACQAIPQMSLCPGAKVPCRCTVSSCLGH